MTVTPSTTPSTTQPPTYDVAPPPATILPSYDEDAAPVVPRLGLGKASPDERFAKVGSWVAGLGLAWVVTQRLLPLDGLPWLLIAWFVLGVAVSAVTAGMTGGRIEVKDRVAESLVTGAALLVGAAVVSTVVFVALRGWRPLLHLNFWTDDMSGVGPKDGFDTGGVVHAITGSAIELGIALLITLPLGIGTAVFMTEVGGKFARIVRTVVEAMTALPSIVAGLFVYTVFIIALGQPRSGLAAGLAISVMILPIIARASDVVLRVVPGGLREASLALGASRWRTVWHVVLPTARPGLATAVILGVARGVGETSPVLLTSGAAAFLVTNPTDGVMNSLPLFIYSNVRSGEPVAIERAFAAATALLILVLILFTLARVLARPRGNRPPLRSRLARRRPSDLESR
ncbi:phosphate ABC transporter permease PstA [Nocardioides flavescens]|uniref:Phosphate transport system permease protein PstA n=1 Tax=Nocardioides flavescens TaxID=2691959 RepID=A0A6L7F3D9_9ACTN|nr:phosphate ABC transporter permease PstA [Nocardioides flavescens]MXG91743.1 phosphate ABC transporter permease PstA [Nocardioides flavescens]